MKRSKFTEEQIIGVLGEQEAGVTTAQVCRRHGISSATLLRLEGEVWRHERVGCEAAEGDGGGERQAEAAACGRPARQRRVEGSPGAKVVAPAAKRKAVAHLVQAHEVGERRACSLVSADRTMIRYRSRRPDDTDLRKRLRDLAGARRRFGSRRLHVLLRQEGWTMNRKKTQRLYREEGLSVRRRRGRKRATETRAPILTSTIPNARWSVDFIHDQLVTGRRLRILNVVIRHCA